MNNTLGLYLHIPFCLGKCNYCDFYSLAEPKKMQAYTDVLCRALINRAASVHTRIVDTVYVGGGTPSLLGADALVGILSVVRSHYRLAPNAEVTVEVNPATIDAAGLATLRTVANRLSIGVQSADDTLLAALGRRHTFAQAKATVQAAVTAGFTDISCDLMFGLPGQTIEMLTHSISEVAALPITHLSLYALTIEPDTPFGRQAGLSLPDDDTVADMYQIGIKTLAASGFSQYEISNFARGGHRSRHNLRYWNGEEYLGFGPAAYSFFDGVRYGMPRDLSAFLATEGDAAKLDALQVDREVLDRAAKESEYIMLRFRLADGVGEAEFAARFGHSFTSTYRAKMQPYIESGHIIQRGNGWRLTPEGFAISNYILSDLLSL